MTDQRTFILTWNPDACIIEDDEYREYVDLTTHAGELCGSWSTGNSKHTISPGDRFFLLRQGRDRGIIASGHFDSEVYQEESWDGSGDLANFADVIFDEWRPLNERVTIEELFESIPECSWNSFRSSGCSITPEVAIALEAVWSRSPITRASVA